MKCNTTNVPPAAEIDIPALEEKYRQERELRVNPKGQKQYVKPVDDFSESYEVDPHTPLKERDAIVEDIDAVVLGGGWSGLLAGVHLKKAGVTNFRNIDHAGDFGGVWYWNRYPGIQCDNDGYCYLPLLEEMGYMPPKKFVDGYDIYDYIRSIADRFNLYEKALFHTMVSGLKWDDGIKRWRVTTNRGDEIRARFVVMANGLLNIPKLPAIPGIHEFKGKMFHTARWDYDYTGGSYRNPQLDKLADKRVAIIGTGATAIQAVPSLGKYAKELYVLQRTPSTIDERTNPPTDPEWVKTLKPGWQDERKANFQRAAIDTFQPGDPDLICDIWTELNRNLVAEFDQSGWPTSPEEYLAHRNVMDFRLMERLRQRVDALVEDKETAEALKPWYRFLCKRPCSNNEFYTTFNKPNVTLVDVSATRGVECMTEKGFVANGKEYEIDCMMFASGFEVTSDLDRRWGIETIEGRDGVSIYNHWADGYETLHGMMSRGFPNQFFVGFYQGGFNATTTETFSRQGQHIAYIIKEALSQGATSVEPSQEAQDAWVRHVRETAIDISQFQEECTPSYFNNEGESQVDSNGEKKFRWYLGESYGPGWDAFQKLMQEWRDKGDLEGLVVGKD
ncbi:NAD(P)/FAD-dependent oxidoreductase [Ketobacter sp. MCCC 1A13808]|uniref:flavin-containing monooxygenase n=1 Tax=Ketobacter sp. MCCC 1A13808 TaxID=2602738 RepID=UPI0012EC7738|nr:NAD(P)/FAD-dependent oxidoreductase [Ketobacter sp. MCCC 1A13808]MVF13526.1 NAD(P)/FAD-dependent oxidoreductase [Ketobacter sp. MCCC 1A13808]